MKIKKIYIIIPSFLILISFALAIYFYPIFPAQIATHWGINGQANGFSSKTFGLFFMPILSSFLLLLFVYLPKIDPYKKNFNQFQKYYQNFINLIFVFFFYLYLITIFWNLGFHFNMIQILSPAFASLFYYAGVLMSHTKRNWFVGIRTPWTISNKEVWEKTHKIGGKLFKLTGLISLLSLFLPQFSIFFIIIPVITTTIFVFIYSYLEYQKIN
jgi:immunity protein, SdpI family